MEKCQHFTIRGAVAEFRTGDWMLNYPFPVCQELNPKHIKSLLPYPLDTPKFKWWRCKSCVRDLIDVHCPHQFTEPGTFSYNELVTWKESSGVDGVIVNASVDMDANACDLPLLICSDIENGGAEGTGIYKHPEEDYEDRQTSAVGHTTESDLLIPRKRRVILFDLNETPTLETSEQMLEIDGPVTEELQFENPKYQIVTLAPGHEQEPENTEAPKAISVTSGDMGNCDCRRSLEREIDDSFKGSNHDVILEGDSSKKKKTPKYRTLSELLNCKAGESSENRQSNRTMVIDRAPAPKPCKKSKLHFKQKKQLRINVEQGPERSSRSKDAAGSNAKNRVSDFNMSVEKNDFLLDDENLQRSRVPCHKRKRRESLAQDKTSKRGNSGPQNGTGNLLLPKKKRILSDEVSKVYSPIEKLIQLESAAIKRKTIHGQPSSHKRGKHDSAGKDTNKRMLGAQKKKKSRSDVSGCATGSEQRTFDKRPTIVGNGSVLLGRPNPSLHFSYKEALTGMHLLSMAAAETGDFDIISESGVSRAIPPLYAVREKVDIPSCPVAPLKPDVLLLPIGSEGQCAQAAVPTERVSIDEAMKYFMLGSENLPFRNRCTSHS